MIERIGGIETPRRLREVVAEDSPLARALVSARERQPTAEETDRLEAGLFAALGAGAVAATVRATLVQSAPATASTTSAVASIAMKATLVLALGAGGGVLGVRWLHAGRQEPPAPLTTPPAAIRAPAPPAFVPSAPAAESAAAAAPSVVDHARRPSRSRALNRPSSDSSPPSVLPSLQAELQLMEEARAVVVTDPARALQLCEAHLRAYPAGVMAEERDAIAVTALLALHRVPEARTSLAAFRRRYPASPQTARLDERLRAVDTDR